MKISPKATAKPYSMAGLELVTVSPEEARAWNSTRDILAACGTPDDLVEQIIETINEDSIVRVALIPDAAWNRAFDPGSFEITAGDDGAREPRQLSLGEWGIIEGVRRAARAHAGLAPSSLEVAPRTRAR